MKTSFVNTGQHFATMTTVDDPELRVLEEDNGHRWTIYFKVGNTTIDLINLEYAGIYEIHEDVLSLPVYVYGYEEKYLGTVAERIAYAK